MIKRQPIEPRDRWPRWWRLVIVVVSTLILCSCRAAAPPLPDVAAGRMPGAVAHPGMIAQASRMPHPLTAPQIAAIPVAPLPLANAAAPLEPPADPAVVQVAAQQTDSPIIRVAAQSPPYPEVAQAPMPPAQPMPPPQPPMIPKQRADAPRSPAWPPYPEQVISPSGPATVGLPQPPAECIFDGGDRELKARVSPDWVVNGLEPEDTIGHADTIDGSVIVAPSNRVKIYAPRFSAVRSVIDLQQGRHVDSVVNHDQGLGPQPLGDSLRLDTHRQNVEARGDIADRGMRNVASLVVPNADLNVTTVRGFHDGFLPFEDLSIMRRGVFDNADKPRLALGKQAANTWAHDLNVQVAVDGRLAASVAADQRAQAILLFEDKSGPAKLRVIKVASTSAANVGDVVDFTIRYDNVGDQTIGNVTIIDNLTPRLEYVPDSAQASRPANFSSKANEAGSLVLRWEVIDPLPKGEGGLVRFKCRVR